MSEILIGLTAIGGAIAVGAVFAWVHSRLTANLKEYHGRVEFEPLTILFWTLGLTATMVIAYAIGEAITYGGAVPYE